MKDKQAFKRDVLAGLSDQELAVKYNRTIGSVKAMRKTFGLVRRKQWNSSRTAKLVGGYNNKGKNKPVEYKRATSGRISSTKEIMVETPQYSGTIVVSSSNEAVALDRPLLQRYTDLQMVLKNKREADEAYNNHPVVKNLLANGSSVEEFVQWFEAGSKFTSLI